MMQYVSAAFCILASLWGAIPTAHAAKRQPKIRGRRNMKVLAADGSETASVYATTWTRFLGPQSFSLSSLENSLSVVFFTETLSTEAYDTCDVGEDFTGKIVVILDEDFECYTLDKVYDAFEKRGAQGVVAVTTPRVPGWEYYRHDYRPSERGARLGTVGDHVGDIPFLSVSKYDHEWATFVNDALGGSECPVSSTDGRLRECSDAIQLLLAPGENVWRAMYESFAFVLIRRYILPALYYILALAHFVFNYAARKRQEAAGMKGPSLEVFNWFVQGLAFLLVGTAMAFGCSGMDEFFRWRHSIVYTECLKGSFAYMLVAHFSSSRRQKKGKRIFPAEFDPSTNRSSKNVYRFIVVVGTCDIDYFLMKYVLLWHPSTTNTITLLISVLYTITLSSMCVQILCWSVPAIFNAKNRPQRLTCSAIWGKLRDDKSIWDALTATLSMGYVICLAYARPQRDWTPASHFAMFSLLVIFRGAACGCSLMFLRNTPHTVPDVFKKSEKYFKTNSMEGRDNSSFNSEVRSSGESDSWGSARENHQLANSWTERSSGSESEDWSYLHSSGSERSAQFSTRSSSHHPMFSPMASGKYPSYIRPEDALLVRRAVRPYPVSEYRERTDGLNEAIFSSSDDTGNLLVCLTSPETIFHLFGFSCANRVVAVIVYFQEDAARLPQRIPDDVEVGQWETVISVERQPLLLKSGDPNAPRRLWHACVFVDCLEGGWSTDAAHVLIEELRSRAWLDVEPPGMASTAGSAKKVEAEYVVGLELTATTTNVTTVTGIASVLQNEGFRIRDITCCAQEARSIKTKLQQQSIRKAAEILATGMEAAHRAAAIGSSELEVHSEHNMAMMRAGGEILSGAPTSVSINSGGLPGKRVSRRRIEGGDFVHVRTSGIFNRERVSCSRVFFVRPYVSFFNLAPKELHQAFRVAGGLFSHIESTVFCGDSVVKLNEEIDKYFKSHGMPKGRGYPLPLDGEEDEWFFSCPHLRAAGGDHQLPPSDAFDEGGPTHSVGNVQLQSAMRSDDSLVAQHLQARSQYRFDADVDENGVLPKRRSTHLQHGMAFRLQSVAWCFVESWGRPTEVPLIETLLVGKEVIQAHGPAKTRRLVEVSPLLLPFQRGNF